MARRRLAPLERRLRLAASVARLEGAIEVVAALTLALWLTLAALVAFSQPTGKPPMRSVPVVTDPPVSDPPTTTHIVIEGALP